MGTRPMGSVLRNGQMVKYSVSGSSRTRLTTLARVSRHTDDCNTEDRETQVRNTADHNTAPDTSPTPSASCGW
jgi:hypothetical protein